MSTQAPATLQDLFDEVTSPLGFEVICWEWAGQGKYRVLRLYIDRLVEAQEVGDAQADKKPEEPVNEAGQEAGPKSAAPADKPVPPASQVTLQDCSKISRMIGLALDAAEEESRWAGVAASLKSGYTLEVSSPGIERPLTKAAHFLRFVGHQAAIRCERDIAGVENRKKFSGRIAGVATEGQDPMIRLQDEELKREVEIPLSVIRKAHLLYEGRI